MAIVMCVVGGGGVGKRKHGKINYDENLALCGFAGAAPSIPVVVVLNVPLKMGTVVFFFFSCAQ